MQIDELSEGWFLLLVGILLLTGYAAHLVGRKLHVPRVTLLMLLGIISGPYALNLFPEAISGWFPHLTHFSLAMVGFLLGEAFVGKELRSLGARVLELPVVYVLFTATLVFLTTWALEWSLVTALVLAGIAPTSAPAATIDIVRETHAHGPLSRTLLKVVAIDDALGIVLFSLLLGLAESVNGGHPAGTDLISSLWEIVGATLLGLGLGFPMAWATGRLQRGEPAVLEAAGFVFLCGGFATLLGVSYLLACMVLGIVVANRARHHTRPFHAIEGASDPFLAIFFLMAGYQVELNALASVGLLGAAYVIARATGLILGGYLGAQSTGAPPAVRDHIGWCLLPQAGVALGLSLLVSDRIPELGDRLLPMIVATTVIFEVAGPIFTQRHLRLAGEIAEA